MSLQLGAARRNKCTKKQLLNLNRMRGNFRRPKRSQSMDSSRRRHTEHNSVYSTDCKMARPKHTIQVSTKL